MQHQKKQAEQVAGCDKPLCRSVATLTETPFPKDPSDTVSAESHIIDQPSPNDRSGTPSKEQEVTLASNSNKEEETTERPSITFTLRQLEKPIDQPNAQEYHLNKNNHAGPEISNRKQQKNGNTTEPNSNQALNTLTTSDTAHYNVEESSFLDKAGLSPSFP